jgi:hypothetical protein
MHILNGRWVCSAWREYKKYRYTHTQIHKYTHTHIHRKITVLTETSVKKVEKNVVWLQDGTPMHFGLCVWSTGVKPTELIEVCMCVCARVCLYVHIIWQPPTCFLIP